MEKRDQAQEDSKAHPQKTKGEKENREEPAALFPKFLWEPLQWMGRPEGCHKVWNVAVPCFLSQEVLWESSGMTRAEAPRKITARVINPWSGADDIIMAL